MNTEDKLNLALQSLCEHGHKFDKDSVIDRFHQYSSLIQEWNSFASLLSVSDAKNRLCEHFVDSLGLALRFEPHPAQGALSLLDVGSGGGFPALPLQILLPSLRLTLVEHSDRKLAFLRKAIAELELPPVSVMPDSFDRRFPSGDFTFATSRAIEKPRVVLSNFVEWLPLNTTIIWQSFDPSEMMREGLQCREIEDTWDTLGLRRSRLYEIFWSGDNFSPGFQA